jgi:hypothetical protein
MADPTQPDPETGLYMGSTDPNNVLGAATGPNSGVSGTPQDPWLAKIDHWKHNEAKTPAEFQDKLQTYIYAHNMGIVGALYPNGTEFSMAGKSGKGADPTFLKTAAQGGALGTTLGPEGTAVGTAAGLVVGGAQQIAKGLPDSGLGPFGQYKDNPAAAQVGALQGPSAAKAYVTAGGVVGQQQQLSGPGQAGDASYVKDPSLAPDPTAQGLIQAGQGYTAGAQPYLNQAMQLQSDAAQGKGPSVAVSLAQQERDKNIATQAAIAGAARGGNVAGAMRGAAQAGSQLQLQSQAYVSALRAQEIATARAQLGQTATGAGQLGVSATGTGLQASDSANKTQVADAAARAQASTNVANTAINQQSVNQAPLIAALSPDAQKTIAANALSADFRNKLVGGITSGFGTALGSSFSSPAPAPQAATPSAPAAAVPASAPAQNAWGTSGTGIPSIDTITDEDLEKAISGSY